TWCQPTARAPYCGWGRSDPRRRYPSPSMSSATCSAVTNWHQRRPPASNSRGATERAFSDRTKPFETLLSQQRSRRCPGLMQKDAGSQIRQCGERQACLDLSQPLLVDDAEPVAQHAAVGVEIRIDRHDTPYNWRTRSRICEVLISPRAHRSAITSTPASATSPSARMDAAA